MIQDGEILALLGQGDVFGDSQWKRNKLAKSAVHVRALTYCDIHMINVDKLKEVMEFYKVCGSVCRHMIYHHHFMTCRL